MEILNNIVGTIFAVISMMLSITIDERKYRLLMHYLHLDKVANWVLRHHM